MSQVTGCRHSCFASTQKLQSAWCLLQTSSALERILADIKPAAPSVPVWTAEQQQQQAAFNAANCSISPAVYYSPGVYQDLAALYSDLQAALLASLPQAADTKKGTVACCAFACSMWVNQLVIESLQIACLENRAICKTTKSCVLVKSLLHGGILVS